MCYTVTFVEDCQLPERVHWALIRDGQGGFYFIVKRSKITPLVLAEGWAAYRKAIRIPAPRPSLIAVR